MKKKAILKVCTFAIVITLFLPGFSMGANGSEGDMTANGVAVDSQDNIIVTGEVYDYSKDKWIIRTEKYDGSDGHLIWSKDFDKYNFNIGKDVAVDSNDNIIVAGSVNETAIVGFNYCLIKYSKDGTYLWHQTYHRKFYDTPWRVVIDNANNIFVTGLSLKIDLSVGISSDYWTIKCASNGNKLKEKVFDESDTDLAFGIALDGNNNIIVTGSSNYNGQLVYCTLKYDNNLNKIWGLVYYGSGNENNSASGVAVDSHNNVIVTGGSEEELNKDYLTVKYDSSGNKQKDHKYDIAGTDDALGIAVDSKDNIIVTGTSTDAYGSHFCTVKYGNNLNDLWIKKEDFTGGAKDVAIDSNNNIIVTGYNEGDRSHYYTIKYSPGGEILWEGGGGEGPAQPPVADFTFTPANPTRADFVHFNDKSTGSVTSWQWDFGDGHTSNDRNPLHKYAATGTFDVTLTVSGPAGTDTKIGHITVSNAKPVADFTYSPLNPIDGQTVSFDASSSYDPDGSIASWSWDFGDGNASDGQSTTHQYTTNKTYTVTLTVTDNDGMTTSTKKFVTVNSEGDNIPPVPALEYSPLQPQPGEIVSFNASESYDPDGSIDIYKWDWGDGTYDEKTIPTVTHTWYEEGEYLVTLQVEDNGSAINTYSFNMKIGGGNPELIISLGVSNIAPFNENSERTIPIKIYCYNFSANNVTISILENANLTIIPITPNINLKNGEEKDFLIRIKVPKLSENLTVGTKTIRIQATGDNGIKSNIEDVDIIIHRSGGGTPGFAALLTIGAIFIALLFMRKIR
ncbi:MAG: PKD domain-containing protein [Candidatus Thermoplasmatota archaeon]|nr:PKD domain-containing protein [Candidatus Thermoplasmatota archaeon]